MKIEVELTENLKREIFRQCLVEQYKKITRRGHIHNDNITYETLTNNLKNLIYWNSNTFQFEEFLNSIGEKNTNEQ